MNPETLRHSTAGGRELWGSQPAPLLVLPRRLSLEITTNKNQTKNHLHKFVYKAANEEEMSNNALQETPLAAFFLRFLMAISLPPLMKRLS